MLGIKMIGSVHTYAKSMQMKTEVRQKQESGQLAAKTSVAAQQSAIPDDESLKKSMMDALNIEEKEETSELDQNKMQEIKHKLMLGSTLTEEELEFLKERSPELYEEYVQAENERKQEEKDFERQLKACKTQEEVGRLENTTLNRYMMRIRTIQAAPNTPPEKKAIKIAAEKRKIESIEEKKTEFVEKGKYRELPTEAEVAEAMKAQVEELREENGLNPEGIHAGPAAEKVAEPKTSNTTDQVENREREKVEKTEQDEAEIDIETEAERKVRRAKARAAYAALGQQSDRDEDSGQSWNA